MAIIRIHTGSDGKSHFQEIVPKLEPRGDKSETAELIPGSGIVVRRFEPTRSNPWHHAPGRYAVFTLSGAVDIEIGDGTVRRLGPGDILIAEDLSETLPRVYRRLLGYHARPRGGAQPAAVWPTGCAG